MPRHPFNNTITIIAQFLKKVGIDCEDPTSGWLENENVIALGKTVSNMSCQKFINIRLKNNEAKECNAV